MRSIWFSISTQALVVVSVAQDIGAKWPDVLFRRLPSEVQADGVAQQRQVFLLRQPRRKVTCFPKPNLAQVDALEAARVHTFPYEFLTYCKAYFCLNNPIQSWCIGCFSISGTTC